jgi:hypothetical protein
MGTEILYRLLGTFRFVVKFLCELHMFRYLGRSITINSLKRIYKLKVEVMNIK